MIFNPVIAGGGGGVKLLRGSLNKTSYSASSDKKFTISGIDFTPTDFLVTVVVNHKELQPIYISYDSSTKKTTLATVSQLTTGSTIYSETFSNASSSKIYWTFSGGKLTLDAAKLYNSDNNQFFKKGKYEWVIWGE